MTKAAEAKRLGRIRERLDDHYPEAECALHHDNPLQLLIATILSAQCTDGRVNQVTPGLFRKYPDAVAFARADPNELESAIRSTGFFRSKARSIRAACQALVENHRGQVPASLDDLVRLPGVGRKTANVVLGTAFGVPGITVDTHVGRIARRLGLTRNEDPVKVEFDLMKVVPRDRWSIFSLQVIWHGRRVCFARKPRCPECFLRDLCPYPARAGRASARRPAPRATPRSSLKSGASQRRAV